MDSELSDLEATLPRNASAQLEGATQQARLLVGRTLSGRYLVEDLIASGAMGWVYRATEVPFRRAVAVKVVRLEPGTDRGTMFARFRLEAESLARLTHPHIVTVLDYGQTEGGQPYLVMEYLAGRPLATVLEESGPLPAERVLRLAAQMSRALRKAHDEGIIHRDVKPGNVILCATEDEEDFAKLLDFGIVKWTVPMESSPPSDPPARPKVPTLTQSGHLVGSPLYMSPEQIVGDALDLRSDIYSLGATLFHLLTGRPPFVAETNLEVIRMHISREPPSLQEALPGLMCPPTLERIVSRCMRKSPGERYDSMRALLAELRVAWAELGARFKTEGREPPPVRFDSEIVAPRDPIPSLSPEPVRVREVLVRPHEDTAERMLSGPPARPSGRLPLLLGLAVGAALAVAYSWSSLREQSDPPRASPPETAAPSAPSIEVEAALEPPMVDPPEEAPARAEPSPDSLPSPSAESPAEEKLRGAREDESPSVARPAARRAPSRAAERKASPPDYKENPF